MKAIVLAGGESSHCYPLAEHVSLLPILNRPLLTHQLEWLRDSGVLEVAVVIGRAEAERIQVEWSEVFSGLRVRYIGDSILRGPAGAIKQCEEFVGTDTFCVLNGNVFPRELDLEHLVEFHRGSKGVVTLGVVERAGTSGSQLENVLVGSDGSMERVEILHASKDRRRPRQFSGLYVFSPDVLRHIPSSGYADIKEQLLPVLSQAGLGVNLHQVSGRHLSIGSLSEYFRVHHNILQDGLFDESRWAPLGDRVWSDRGVKVAPSAHLIGPVILGRDCVIEDHAYVIGPAVIGDDCRVLEGSLVRESILGAGVTISRRSKVEYALVGARFVTKEEERVRDCVAVHKQPSLALALSGSVHPTAKAKALMPWKTVCGYRQGCKRVIDVLLGSLALLAAAPMMALIAAAIKLDSPGEVFFRQKRCGLGGREFYMIKFRTMCQDADFMQRALWARKTVDGPMFKLDADPRITRVGRFLRKSSLDELPQLINVLRSEMSLVGPRPLAMGEMRFSPSWRDVRLSVKPGITGMWQVNGRSHAAFHDWIRYDINYVRNYSLWLDLKILFRTIVVVFRRVGAH